MAVKVLKDGRRRGASLGIRVDDAVAAKRRREALSIVDPAPSHRSAASSLPAPTFQRPPSKPVRFVAAPPRCTDARGRAMSARALSPTLASASVVTPVRAAAQKPDPMFDRDVEEARSLATSVRPVPLVAAAAATRPESPTYPGIRERRRGYRLTLRGQRVVVAMGFALSIALGALVGAVIGPAPAPEHTATMVVESGDSLWSIASDFVEHGEDVRPVVEQIAELNDLHSPLIAAGQTLLVPSK